MRRFLLLGSLVLLAACSSGGPGPAQPGATPDGLRGLIGVSGRSGEAGLQVKGYEHRNTEKTDSSSISHWRGKDGSCIAVTTADGRYASIVVVDSARCADSGNAAPAPGRT